MEHYILRENILTFFISDFRGLATLFDLNIGYYNIRITKYAINLCTIIILWGEYHYKRLLIEVKNHQTFYNIK